MCGGQWSARTMVGRSKSVRPASVTAALVVVRVRGLFPPDHHRRTHARPSSGRPDTLSCVLIPTHQCYPHSPLHGTQCPPTRRRTILARPPRCAVCRSTPPSPQQYQRTAPAVTIICAPRHSDAFVEVGQCDTSSRVPTCRDRAVQRLARPDRACAQQEAVQATEAYH